MTFEQWIEKYKPIMDKSDPSVMKDWHPFDSSNKLIITKASEEGRLWTLLDADGTLWISQGLHIVNRLGVVITELPSTEEVEDICMWSEDDEKSLIIDTLETLGNSLTEEQLNKLSIDELRELEMKHLDG